VSKIFLGRWWHWAILVVLCTTLWVAGDSRMHVIHFNIFVSALLAGVSIILAILLAGTRPGEQVTREVLEPAEPD
jgi:hypothetical protein